MSEYVDGLVGLFTEDGLWLAPRLPRRCLHRATQPSFVPVPSGPICVLRIAVRLLALNFVDSVSLFTSF